jgi:hypothetical protein
MAAHAVGGEAEVAQRLERAELDLRAGSACVMIVPVT